MNLTLMQEILISYLIIINIVTFFTFLIDKIKSTRNSWRISEKCLFKTTYKESIPTQIADIIYEMLTEDKFKCEAKNNFTMAEEVFSKPVLHKKRNEFYGAFIEECKKKCLI